MVLGSNKTQADVQSSPYRNSGLASPQDRWADHYVSWGTMLGLPLIAPHRGLT